MMISLVDIQILDRNYGTTKEDNILLMPNSDSNKNEYYEKYLYQNYTLGKYFINGFNIVC